MILNVRMIRPVLRGAILVVAFALAGPAAAQTPPPPPTGGGGTPPPPPTLPTTKEQCFNNGWQAFKVFKNQGDCVSYVATKGKNAPAK